MLLHLIWDIEILNSIFLQKTSYLLASSDYNLINIPTYYFHAHLPLSLYI